MKLLAFATAITAFLSEVSALQPRNDAPAFSNVNAVVGTDITKISSSDYNDKWLVMLFYPFDFTYVCPTELIAFSEA